MDWFIPVAYTHLDVYKRQAVSLRIDPEKILASGGSAVGHLAAATAFCDNINHSEDGNDRVVFD